MTHCEIIALVLLSMNVLWIAVAFWLLGKVSSRR